MCIAERNNIMNPADGTCGITLLRRTASSSRNTDEQIQIMKEAAINFFIVVSLVTLLTALFLVCHGGFNK